jgi:hypothetical protein
VIDIPISADACVNVDDTVNDYHEALTADEVEFIACEHSSECTDPGYCCGGPLFCMCMPWNDTEVERQWCVWP